MIVAFAPIYVNAYTISYALWPDYLLLNVYLIAAAVFLFQWQWRSRSTAHPLLRTIGAGVFVGALTANKISMLFVGGPLVAAVIVTPGVSWGRLSRRTTIAAVAAIATFTFFFFAAGLFQFQWLSGVARAWFHFMRNPGARRDFQNNSLAISNRILGSW